MTLSLIHSESGLDYRMPDLSSKPFIAKAVCEHEGRLVAAVALKMEAEAYLWVQKGLPPALKWDAIRLLQVDIVKQAARIGIDQMVAYVPATVERFFAKRLVQLRWAKARAGWSPWAREVRQ